MHRRAVRMLLLFMGLAVPWACDDSSTLVLMPNPAIRIIIDDSRCPQVVQCDQCQLDFEAYDKNSQPAQFSTVLWNSNFPALATVDDMGRVSGWSPGEVTIEAEVLDTGASDAVKLQVVPNRRITCSPPGDLTELLSNERYISRGSKHPFSKTHTEEEIPQ